MTVWLCSNHRFFWLNPSKIQKITQFFQVFCYDSILENVDSVELFNKRWQLVCYICARSHIVGRGIFRGDVLNISDWAWAHCQFTLPFYQMKSNCTQTLVDLNENAKWIEFSFIIYMLHHWMTTATTVTIRFSIKCNTSILFKF